MTIQSIAFIFTAGGAFSYSGYKITELIRLMRAHKRPTTRWDRIPDRLIAFVVNVLGQHAVLQKRGIGILHTMIFWGFLIITTGTLEQFLGTLIPGASFEFLGPTLYKSLLVIQDTFTLFVFLAVLGAAYRRLIIRPPYLGQSNDANLVLVFTGGLMVAIFLMNMFGIAASHWNNPDVAHALYVSQWLAHLIPSGISQDLAEMLFITFKWVHMLLVLGFGMYIPSSKHLHVLAAGPNTLLKTLDRAKGMRTINFETETQLGAARINDMSWKDALDYYSCTECGRCQELCPAWNTQKPLSPKKLITDLKHNLYDNKTALLSNTGEVTPLINQEISQDVIWACTSCRACEIACPVFIEHTDKIYDIRRNLVMNESQFPAGIQNVFKNLETNATPWAFSSGDRANWAADLAIPTLSDNPKAEYLLWVGCAGSFDDRNKKVVRAFVSLLKKSKIDFAILGNEEQCTGDPARRIGNEFLFQTMATANVETLNRYQVKKIITACPHCLNTLKNEYKDFGGNYTVIHHSEFIAELLTSGKIKPTQSSEKITFHDSCYLGRWNNIYDAPRKTLSGVSSDIVEMKSNHDQSMCCGAGGGRMFMEETLGKRINITRTEQALATKATVIASSCPFCLTMLTDGVKSKELNDSVKTLDIAELMDQATQAL
jgi:Fe-S oxidoreductase